MPEHFAVISENNNFCLINLTTAIPHDQWRSDDLQFIAIICAGKLGDDFEKFVTYKIPKTLAEHGYNVMLQEDINEFKNVVRRSLQRHLR